LLELLAAGEIDLALVGLASAPPAGIATSVISDEELVAAVGAKDRLAGRSTIPLRSLAGRALIALPPGTGIRRALDDGCGKAGFKPRITFEASDPVMLAELAARSLGVAIVPRSLADARDHQLHALRITAPELRSRLELAWRAEGPISPAARALLNQARDRLSLL
jgi:DNA-binding transcriptional LysR family regulator